MNTKLTSSNKNYSLAFEEARESVVRLSALKPFLMPADEETLSILMDKKLMSNLRKSLSDSKARKTAPYSFCVPPFIRLARVLCLKNLGTLFAEKIPAKWRSKIFNSIDPSHL
ncbi:MAG: hypothetical protein Q7S34_00540 [bacterium]|nr:hypothetical protein [bacterium]